MVSAHASRIKLITVNTFGALGYISITIQWMWALLLYAPYLLTDSVQNFLLPQKQPVEEVTYVVTASESSVFMIALALVITAAMVALVIYIALKTPSVVGRAGHKVTSSAAKATLPIITRRHPIKGKRRQILTARLIAAFKLALVIIPFALILPTNLIDGMPLSFNIIIIVAAAGIVASSLFMTSQYVVAWLLKIPAKQLW